MLCFSMLHIFHGPLITHRYFFILVDGFSKFTELIPMPNQEATTIAHAIATGWIYRHGLPRIMISDQAPNVDGDKIKDLLAKFGIEKRHSSPYHPQGDGQAERGIRNTKQAMRCVLTERNIERNSWSILLPEINNIINYVPNSSIKYTPYKVFFGTVGRHINSSSFQLGSRIRSRYRGN